MRMPDPPPPRDWWRGGGRDHGELPVVAYTPAPDPRTPFLAVLALTGVILLAPQAVFPALAPLRPAFVAAGIAIVAHLLYALRARQGLFRPTGTLCLAAGLGGWAVLSVPMSMWPGGSLEVITQQLAKALVLMWLLSVTVTTLPRLRAVAWALSLIAVPMALSALSSYRSDRFIAGSARIVGYDSPLANNPNDLALVLNLVLPLTVALLLGARGLTRAALGVIVGLEVMGVVLTFSRGGFLTLVTIVVVLFVKRVRTGQGPPLSWAVVLLVLATLAVPLLPAGYLERISTIESIDADPTGSARARWEDSVVALELVAQHPVTGVGIGANALALNEARGRTWHEVHNAYLACAVDLGLPGLLLFVLLVVSSIRAAGTAQRAAAGCAWPDVARLAAGVQVSLIAFAVAALFHPVPYHFYLYYLAGLAIAARRIAYRAPVEVNEEEPPWYAAAAAGRQAS